MKPTYFRARTSPFIQIIFTAALSIQVAEGADDVTMAEIDRLGKSIKANAMCSKFADRAKWYEHLSDGDKNNFAARKITHLKLAGTVNQIV